MIKYGFVTIFTQDISQDMPEEMKQADCIYCKPPCSYNILSRQVVPAAFDTYGVYVKRFFEYVDEITPEYMYLEATASNRDVFVNECKKRFKVVDIDEAYYNRNKKFKCWIIRCSNAEPAPNPGKAVEVNTYIRHICKNSNFRCIADPVMQSAAIEFYAHKNEIKIVSLCSNQIHIDRLRDRIAEYDAKQTVRERKKLAKQKNFQK